MLEVASIPAVAVQVDDIAAYATNVPMAHAENAVPAKAAFLMDFSIVPMVSGKLNSRYDTMDFSLAIKNPPLSRGGFSIRDGGLRGIGGTVFPLVQNRVAAVEGSTAFEVRLVRVAQRFFGFLTRLG